MIIIPYLISWALGFLTCRLVLRSDVRGHGLIVAAFSLGSGLVLSSLLTFMSFLIFDKLNMTFVLCEHAFVLIALAILNLIFFKPQVSFNVKSIVFDRASWLVTALIIASVLILISKAYVYPNGGWDAWSCWNLKARFLSAGGEDWKNMFNPVLWRSSPHYPLLLPLINVWGWIFTKETTYLIPLSTSVIFSSLTFAVLLFGLKKTTRTIPAVLATCLLMTMPFFLTLATSQYSDIVLAFLILASLVSLLLSIHHHAHHFIYFAGFFGGILSFAKNEGAVAAILIAALALGYLFLQKNIDRTLRLKMIFQFYFSFAAGILPIVIFQFLYSPINYTFINGWASSDHPAHWARAKIILYFICAELISLKWNGLWILLVAGIILAGKRCFNRHMIIFPVFIATYLGIVLFYYVTNTYFEILWWLSVSLNRILFSVLPVVIFWVFYSFHLVPHKKNK